MVYDPGFVGVDSIGYPLMLNELQNNYKSFLEWGFLNIGSFTNVNIPTENIKGFDLHKLKPVNDKNFAPGTVWQAPRKDWVYESDITYNGTTPIEIDGIFVNSTFYPAPTGNTDLSYRINYPEGKIIFSTPISTTSSVELNYSYKNIQIYKIEEFPYWKEIQHRSLENKTGFDLSDNKGDFSIDSEHRMQLPIVVIEIVARSSSKPFHLGDISQIWEQDILLHIVSDNPTEKNNIVDVIRLQKDRIIYLYKTKNIIENNINLLNYDGSKNLNGQNYSIIINNPNYRWIESRIKEINISDIYYMNMRLYGAVVRLTSEFIIVNSDPSMCNSVLSE